MKVSINLLQLEIDQI